MKATERYELIRPILQKEKTVKEVYSETEVPISTLYRYLTRFLICSSASLRKGNERIESLALKSRAPHSNPHWFTEEQKDRVILYKFQNPEKSARQIAKDLASDGILQISYHTVSDILKQRQLTNNFF